MFSRRIPPSHLTQRAAVLVLCLNLGQNIHFPLSKKKPRPQILRNRRRQEDRRRPLRTGVGTTEAEKRVIKLETLASWDCPLRSHMRCSLLSQNPQRRLFH